MTSVQSWVKRFALLLLFALYALPLLFVVLASFKSNVEVQTDPAGLLFTPTIEAYQSMFNTNFLVGLGNTFTIAAGVAIVVLVSAVPFAYMLARGSDRAVTISIAMLIVLQMIPAATAVIAQYQVLAVVDLLGTHIGVILAVAAGATPFAVLILRPFFLSIPREVEEAAQLDGAGFLRSFVQVVLPLARNGISLIGVLVFIASWGEFLYPISFLSRQELFPISVLIVQQQTFYGTQWNNIMALAVMGAVPTVILFALVARRLVSGISLGVGK